MYILYERLIGIVNISNSESELEDKILSIAMLSKNLARHRNADVRQKLHKIRLGLYDQSHIIQKPEYRRN